MRASSYRVLVAASMALLTTAAGCGLMDLASFNGVKFQLPKRSYTFNTNDVGTKVPPSGVPSVTCGQGGLVADCCNLPPGAGTANCAMYPLSCEAGMCAAKVLLERVNTINLADEVPELKQVQGQIIGEIVLEYLDLEIKNEMNVPLPEVSLFVGPDSATTATSPGTHLIGTIPGKAAGYVGTERIELSRQAQQAFSGFAKDVRTPFKVIMSTTYIVAGGSPTPQGMVTVGVSGQVEAKL